MGSVWYSCETGEIHTPEGVRLSNLDKAANQVLLAWSTTEPGVRALKTELETGRETLDSTGESKCALSLGVTQK